MIKNGQVRKVICAFTAPTRASQRLILSEYVDKGLIEAELVPQGTLAERMRAAGAGIPAFYTPAAVGTELAEGRETREFNGREYLLEHALPLDYAFIRACQADAAGNLRSGALSGISIRSWRWRRGLLSSRSRRKSCRSVPSIPTMCTRQGSSCTGSSRSRRRPRLVAAASREHRPMSERAKGLPVSRCATGWRWNSATVDRQSGDRHSDPVLEFRFRREADHLSFRERGDRLRPARAPGEGICTSSMPAASTSRAARRGDRAPRQFLALIRSGRIDVTVLGAYEVAANGDSRTGRWRPAGRRHRWRNGPGLLRQHVFVAMEHQTRDGKPRLVERCAIPATARGVVNLVATNFGLFEVTKQGMALA